jgi:murein DD-endopeptidase MepM/ murein hydrolase activator NlpD
MKNSKTLSVFFVPDDGASPTVWKLSRFSLRLLKISAILIILLVAVGAISYWRVADTALRARELEEKNRLLGVQARKMAALERTLAEIQARDRQLRVMLGLGEGDSTATGMPRGGLLVGSFRAPEGQTPPEGGAGSISRFTPSGRPVEGWITADFEGKSTASKRGHEGIDIAARHGSVVKATAEGIVVFAGWDDVFGNLVAIDHGGHFVTRYGHNSDLLVQRGDKVWKGQAIALVGNTGHSTAPHLHYEVLEKGQPKDPRKFLLIR